ncbi:MAG: hypothetical protein EHM83_03445 [Burkholderiales bacterium]|nr:MAG: hypothetical protein EHM83_03445 [Burkholderiales bacterium]
MTSPDRAGRRHRESERRRSAAAPLLDLLWCVRVGDLSSLGYRLRGSATWGYTGTPLNFERLGDLELLRRFSDLLRPLMAPR